MKAAELIEAVDEYAKLEDHFFRLFMAELDAEMVRYAALPADGSSEHVHTYLRGQAQQREAIRAWASMRHSSNTEANPRRETASG